MEKDYSEITANRLYELRTKKGYTMEKLAEMIGVSKGTISKWEKGSIKNMRQDKVLLLAEIFNVSPTYIMGYEENKNIEKFTELYSQLNSAQQTLIDNMLIALIEKQEVQPASQETIS